MAAFGSELREKELLKEAYKLTIGIAAMDKRIEHDLHRNGEELREWVENNEVPSFARD